MAGGSALPVGTMMDFLPRVRREVVDLTAIATLSEAATNELAGASAGDRTNGVPVRTNLAVAVRLRMPMGSGAFLLEAGQGPGGTQRTGVLISTRRPKEADRSIRRNGRSSGLFPKSSVELSNPSASVHHDFPGTGGNLDKVRPASGPADPELVRRGRAGHHLDGAVLRPIA